MAGIKGKGGQPGRSGRQPGFSNPNAGRNRTSLKPLNIAIVTETARLRAMFSTPVDCSTLGLEIEFCACGGVGWYAFEIIAQPHQALGKPDGDVCTLGRVEVAGRPARHTKKCNATGCIVPDEGEGE